jgi:excisionase family DNA binding protein
VWQRGGNPVEGVGSAPNHGSALPRINQREGLRRQKPFVKRIFLSACERVYCLGMGDAWITPHEASLILGVTAARVRQLVRDGALPGQQKGRFYLIRRRDVEKFGKLPRGVPGRPRRLR